MKVVSILIKYWRYKIKQLTIVDFVYMYLYARVLDNVFEFSNQKVSYYQLCSPPHITVELLRLFIVLSLPLWEMVGV